jgi:hypothetical protein
VIPKTIYRIVVQIPSKGIERTLPYILLEILKAEQTAEMLNTMLSPGYKHYVKSEDAGKEKHAR